MLLIRLYYYYYPEFLDLHIRNLLVLPRRDVIYFVVRKFHLHVFLPAKLFTSDVKAETGDILQSDSAMKYSESLALNFKQTV